MTYMHNKIQRLIDEHPNRYVAVQRKDLEGLFWRLYAVFSDSATGFGNRIDMMSADSIDELRIWCDLNGIALHHEEPIDEI